MTRQKMTYIIKTTATALVAFCLLWLTLLDVHTGWCEELPVLQNAMFVIGSVAFVSVIFKKQMCKICWLDKIVLLWFVYITFNYWFISPYPAGERCSVFLSSLLLYILLRYTLAKNNKQILLLALCVGGAYEAVLGVMQLMGWEYSRHSMFDVTGTFFNPGPFSAYLVVALSVATAYIYRRRKLYNYPYFKKGMPARRILPTCIYIICGIALFVTAITLPATWSRAAFVAYFIVLLVLFYKKHKKWVLGLVCISTIVGVFLYFAKQGSANGRVLMNIVSMRAIESKPLLGYGIGGFANAFADSQAEYFKENPDSPFVEVAGSPEYAFNEVLQIGVEQGVIGMLFFIVIATGSMIVLLRKKNELAYGWLALLVFSLFSYPFSLQPFRIMAVLFVACAANIISKKKDNSKIICKLPHIALIALCMVIVCCITPRVENKVNATKDWERISGYQSAAFADDYAEWYNTLIDNPKFLFTYGKMLNGMKRYNDSNAALRDGAKVSADPMFYVVMGNNYKELGAYKEAEECYTKAFYINPNKMYPLYQLLQMYIGLNNEVNAKAMAQRIVDFNPKIRSSATDDMKDYAKEYLKKNNND